MYHLISGNLNRQVLALNLLGELLDEEFACLTERQVEKIMSLEFSIHELLRQLAVEKEQTILRLGGGKVLDYAQMLDAEQGDPIRSMYQKIDDGEQNCSRKASRNTQLSLGPLDQSKEMLDYLHSRMLPPKQDAYSKKGRYVQSAPQASIISGKL